MELFSSLSWFPFALAIPILFGIAMVFFKLPSLRGHSSYTAMFWANLFMAILAVAFFFNYAAGINTKLILLALAWGITFSSISLLQMYALKYVDTNALFPITTTLSLIGTIIVAFIFFSAKLTPFQYLGLILAIIIVFFFLYKGKKLQYSKWMIYIGSLIVGISILNKIFQKVAADSFDIRTFMIYQFIFAAIFSLFVFFFSHWKDYKKHIFSEGVFTGLLIGVPAFLGTYVMFIALIRGPFALITSMHSLYIIVTAVMASILFKEQLTKRKIFLMFLAILAIFLIRLG